MTKPTIMNIHRRSAALDTLRAIAILWVIAFHCVRPFNLDQFASLVTTVLDFGYAGVDLFFILSGYLIAGIVLDEYRKEQSLNVSRFWMRRWMRTLPAYYATLALIVGSYLVIDSAYPGTEYAYYLIFLQTYMTDLPHFGWSWSLCVEEHFYLMLPLFVLAAYRMWPKLPPAIVLRGIAILALLSSVIARYLILRSERAGNYWLTHCRLDGLAIGILIATLPKPRISARLLVLVMAAFLVLFLMMFGNFPPMIGTQTFGILAIVFGIIVYASVGESRWERLKIPGARLVSDLSYSLYLTHVIVLKAVKHFFQSRHFLIQLVLFSLFSFVASIALRYLVEIPFLKLRDRVDDAGQALRTVRSMGRTFLEVIK